MNYFENKFFPYLPPSTELKRTYHDCFKVTAPVKVGLPKRIFDILISLIAITIYMPFMIILYLIYLFESAITLGKNGPFTYYYLAISQGQKFRKYKISALKPSAIDRELASKNLWEAYCNDKTDANLTFTGRVAKKFYLDEFPQFIAVLLGHISLIGPRPLAIIHFDKDLENGNVVRKYLKAGLIGYGHIQKGTSNMGDPTYEYEYFNFCLNKSKLSIFFFDIKIIYLTLILILKGGGH